jgi:hypothetical protein
LVFYEENAEKVKDSKSCLRAVSGIYFGQKPAQLYAIELLGSRGYFHRLPGMGKRGKIVILGLGASAVIGRGFNESF